MRAQDLARRANLEAEATQNGSSPGAGDARARVAYLEKRLTPPVSAEPQSDQGEQALLDAFLVGEDVGKAKFMDAIVTWVGNQKPTEGQRREELALTHGMQRLLTLRNGLLVNLIRLLRLNPRESARGGILALVTFMAETQDATCYLTIKRTAKIFARTQRSVRECIADLEQAGLIGVKRNNEGLPQYNWPLIPQAMTTMGISVAWFADALSDKPRASGRPAKVDNIRPKTPGTIVPPLSKKGGNSSAKPPEHLQHSNIASSKLLKGAAVVAPEAAARTRKPARPKNTQYDWRSALNPAAAERRAYALDNVTVSKSGKITIGPDFRSELLNEGFTEVQIETALVNACRYIEGSNPEKWMKTVRTVCGWQKEKESKPTKTFKTGYGGKTTRPSI